MRICGIEFKSSETILVVIDRANDEVKYFDCKIKKITLKDDEIQSDVQSFCNEVSSFFEDNDIELISIKKRSKKGKFAGGPVSFKMEGLIQLVATCDVKLVSSAAVSSCQKKSEITLPTELKKYQEGSFWTACTLSV